MIENQVHYHVQEISFDLLDAAGVVHHPNYLILCERARSIALEGAGCSGTQLWKKGIALALRENRSEYFRPIGMGQKIIVFTQLIEVQNPRLNVIQSIVEASLFPELTASNGYLPTLPLFESKAQLYRLEVKLVCVSLNPFRAVRFPQELSDALRLKKKESS